MLRIVKERFGHRTSLAEARRTGQEYPHPDQRDEGQPRDQERHEPRHIVLQRTRYDDNALAVKPLHESWVVGRVGIEAAAVPVGAANLLTLDDDLTHLALIDITEHLREGDILGYRALIHVQEQTRA